MHMHEHVHIFGVPCLPEPTYLVPLFPRRRLLCYLVMVYITIDDLVLDHLSDSGYHPRLHSCHWPDRLL